MHTQRNRYHSNAQTSVATPCRFKNINGFIQQWKRLIIINHFVILFLLGIKT